MPLGPPYNRAPIVEAILDVQVDPAGAVEADVLAKCQNRVKADYPDRKTAQFVHGHITLGESIATATSSAHDGYVFSSADQKRRFQAKRSGFTFNHLAPYPGWDVFFAEARRLWDEYRRVARPRAYKRIALRYVNRFDIPTERVLLEHYFRTYPEVSRDLPQLTVNFFLRFNLPLDEISAVAAISEAMASAQEPGSCGVILDIDLYRTEDLPDGIGLWPLFETLRVWKNKVFEACITDHARELIT